MLKQKARTTNKEKRIALSIDEREDLSMAIANQALRLPIWSYSFYHIFLPIEKFAEVNTEYILHILNGKDKNVILPKSDFKTSTMTNILLMDSTVIKTNAYSIPEPVDGIEVSSEKIEVVFVPLLAFDKKGHRAGYGKGFYDRFLSECKPDVIKVGLSFFDSEAEEFEDVSESDVPLDFCVTPENVLSF